MKTVYLIKAWGGCRKGSTVEVDDLRAENLKQRKIAAQDGGMIRKKRKPK